MSLVFHQNGFRELDFTISDENKQHIRETWKTYIDGLPPYADDFKGKGIVFCAGGIKYFTCVWIALSCLRQTGCQLPVEIWYKDEELTQECIEALEATFNVTCCKLNTVESGYTLKPLAMLSSSFKEVLFLDADNVCIKDPTYLFDCSEYKKDHAIFWPDYWKTAEDNPIWDIIGCPFTASPEQESGQLLINKEHCWKELSLCLYFNQNNRTFYQFLMGDKDTFRFAWLALKKTFHFISTDPGVCGYHSNEGLLGTTIVQHDIKGDTIFLHRNFLKWDATLPEEKVWKTIVRFLPSATNKIYRTKFASLGHFSMEISGDIELEGFEQNYLDLELVCLEELRKLRSSTFYSEALIFKYCAEERKLKSYKQDIRQ